MNTTSQPGRGAGALSDRGLRNTKRRLYEIEGLIEKCKYARLSPRADIALTLTKAATFVFAVVVFILVRLDVPYNLPGLGLLFPLAIVVTYIVAYKNSARPASWLDMLDEAMAAYEPVSRSAYADLQRELRTLGRFDLLRIEEWTSAEFTAIEMARDLPDIAKDGSRFMYKPFPASDQDSKGD